MSYKIKHLLLASGCYVLLAIGSYLVISMAFTGGVIDPMWIVYTIQWPIIGIVSHITYIIRSLRRQSKKPSFGYIFLGVADLGNAIIGAFILATATDPQSMINYWCAMGATLVLSMLISIDVFHKISP
jgi:hypothetical protein